MLTKDIEDSAAGREQVSVVRYQGPDNIRKMIQSSNFIEAYAHTQLAIEKVLWDKIVEAFSGDKRSKVERRIDRPLKKGSRISTLNLITWAYIVGAINGEEARKLPRI